MRLTTHPERMCAFERYLKEQGWLHGKCKPHSPWQNGIIERSHRTDNEELFHCFRFGSSEERKYQLKLWEQEYNFARPHQSLGGRTPADYFKELFPIHAGIKLIT